MARSFHVSAVIVCVIVILGVAAAGCSSPAPQAPSPPAGRATVPPVTTSTHSPVMTMTMAATPTTATAPSLVAGSPSSPANGPTVPVTLTAENLLFDKGTITVPAGSTVVMTFINKDADIPHNFALYTDTTATKTIFSGKVFNGVNTMTYTFTAPTTPGNYFFRCDVHPTVMFGTFVVT